MVMWNYATGKMDERTTAPADDRTALHYVPFATYNNGGASFYLNSRKTGMSIMNAIQATIEEYDDVYRSIAGID